jgi:hypothetical protein
MKIERFKRKLLSLVDYYQESRSRVNTELISTFLKYSDLSAHPKKEVFNILVVRKRYTIERVRVVTLHT